MSMNLLHFTTSSPRLSSHGRWGMAFLCTALLAGCGSEGPNVPATTTQPGNPHPPSDGVIFVNVAAEVGLDQVSVCGDPRKNHLLESTGAGAAVADYDGDGDDDVYVGTQQTSQDWLAGRKPNGNALYRNNGDGTFTDVAAEAGVDLHAWTAGVGFADYDNDGDKDLYVTTWGPNVLYRNDGDGTFTDVTESAGVAGPPDAWSASAAFGDLDNDGDLDLYQANYCEFDLRNPPFGGTRTAWKGIQVYRGPLGFTGQADVLYRNNGDGTFDDVTEPAGIDDYKKPLYGLGVVMFDADDDRDLDIYVANDSCPNYLWRNDGDFRFTDAAGVAGVATNEDAREQAGMGVDAADFDGDGRIDILVTNFSHDWNTLHRNQGGLVFVDHTFQAGFKDTYLPLAWGTKFLDIDNDGWLDIVVAQGHIYEEVDDHPHLNTHYREANRLYRNLGDGSFENVTATSGPGLKLHEGSRGVATADYDRDGDVDVFITGMDELPVLLRNEGGNRRPWISVRLIGTRSNRDAVGARIALEAGGRTQLREVNPFGSYQSQSSYAVHFGLGDAETVERLSIRWPSGLEEEFTDLPVRRFVTVTEGKGITAEETP